MWRDLRPYVCLSSACDEEVQLFSTDRAWKEHITQRHNGMVFDEPTPAIEEIVPKYCLRGKRWLTSHGYLLEHLRELALYALPRPFYDQDYQDDLDDLYDQDDKDDKEEMMSDLSFFFQGSSDSGSSGVGIPVRVSSSSPDPSQALTRSAMMQHEETEAGARKFGALFHNVS